MTRLTGELDLDELLEDEDHEGIILLDGLDEAIVGMTNRCGFPPTALYSQELVVRILEKRDGMSREEALEFANFNIFGLYEGPASPTFCRMVEGVGLPTPLCTINREEMS